MGTSALMLSRIQFAFTVFPSFTYGIAFGLGVVSGVSKAMGLWGHQVSKAGELEAPVPTGLAQPCPAVLDVKTKPMQLATPPSPFVSLEAVVGMAVYAAKAMLHRKGYDAREMLAANIP